MPSLLFLAQRIPYPPIKGDKIRAWHVLEHLARSHEVHLGCLVDDEEDWRHVPVLREVCADAHFARLNRRRAKLACLRGLLTGEALNVLFYRERGLDAWVRRVIDQVRPEVVFVFSSNMAPYILDRRGQERVRVVDLVDVDSAKWRAYAETGRGPLRWLYAREAQLMEALEARIGRECDWSTFVSAEEAALFTRLVPDSAPKVRAISNGVDAAYFDPARAYDLPFEGEGPAYVFTGAMDYPPNVDAVVWFADEVWPAIRAAAPASRFVIVGASPAPAVQALASRSGITVTGRVPDVRPYLAHAVAVAPMRIARGIQNKVLEAMAMARPVVVTPDALEGIAAVPGKEVLVARDAAGFAARCLDALGPEAAAIGRAARSRVLQDYVWAERLRGFDALLEMAA
ncbi:MAG TPA: TIGR03087 family PEP-CTERM/XrtA system glycosyltransferase [Acetobacteraceae bacterium]|nr:TIGR03087 family PEP-CTERM/XrtA system glycosyltransferase [Acetobacteraceae bacterium]